MQDVVYAQLLSSAGNTRGLIEAFRAPFHELFDPSLMSSAGNTRGLIEAT